MANLSEISIPEFPERHDLEAWRTACDTVGGRQNGRAAC